ncbi:MAG: hypothetical protein IJK20_01005 [Bacteroidales bacterium]|nr:hypothetical protein [Bacteroidales bacterium]
MKKRFLPILLVAALVICGCEGMGLSGGSPRDVSVTIRIPELTATRTAIADNLLSVKWAEGDCIGVAGKNSANTCFALTPESAGQPSGTFTGSIAGNIVSAYYPYSTSAGTDASVAELAMFVTRTGVSGTPDMHYNYMVSTLAEGTPRKGFTMTMVQKAALLNFTVKPNKFLAGGHLNSLVVRVPQRELAGRFKMDLTDAAAPLAFVNSADSVVINLSDSPEMKTGGTISVPFFLNPAVAVGDSLHIILGSDRGQVFVDLKADKALAAGAQLTIPLDIEALVDAGKARIPLDSPDAPGIFATLTTPGVYDASNPDAIVPIVTYKPGEDQYALYTSGQYRYYRIQNFHAGYMVYASTPTAATMGQTVSLKSDNVGFPQIPAATSEVICVNVNSTMGWFYDKNTRLGFILPR